MALVENSINLRRATPSPTVAPTEHINMSSIATNATAMITVGTSTPESRKAMDSRKMDTPNATPTP